jgi:hypothetical protein
MATYSIPAPDGKTYRLDGPDGATQSEVEAEVIKQNPHLAFQTTEGGAATGNPLATQKYANKGMSDGTEKLAAILGSGGLGAAMGAVAPQILQGAATVTRGAPGLAAVSNALNVMAAGAKAAGPAMRSISGGISGLSSETSGQVAEGMGYSQPVAEVARVVGGAVTPELAPLALQLGRFTVSGAPQQAAISYAKSMLAKLSDGRLSPAEQKQLADIQSRIMGEQDPGRAMKILGEAMELGAAETRAAGAARAAALHSQAADVARRAGLAAEAELAKVPGQQANIQTQQAYLKTLQKQAGDAGRSTISTIGENRPLNVIGGELQDAAAKRQGELKTVASETFRQTKAEVDDIVSKLETSGRSVTDLSSYKALVERLNAELKPGVHSKEVAQGYRKILDQITVPAKIDEPPSVATIGAKGFKTAVSPIEAKPQEKPTYQAFTDARRMLGKAFRGKPAEGYEAIDEKAQQEFYGLLSQVQKDFVGEPQTRLLTQYADSRPGLEVFGSKAGTKLTGMDKGAMTQFASDASKIPTAFFSTPKMFASLVEMVGDRELAAQAARQYTANQLASKQTSKQVGEWMTTNRGFLDAVPEVKASVIAYQSTLQNSEREIANIGAKIKGLSPQLNALAPQAKAAANKMLTEGRAGSAALTKEAGAVSSQSAALADQIWDSSSAALKNVRDAVNGGDINRWAAIAPVIERSPDAKKAVFDAVRQVTSEMATGPGAIRKFNEQMRPALEKFDMLGKEEADFISAELAKIGAKAGSEAEKLGLIRRLILQGVAGYSSSAAGRLGAAGFSFASDIPGQNKLAPKATNTNAMTQ